MNYDKKSFYFSPFGILTLFQRNGIFYVRPEFICEECKAFANKEMEAGDFIKEGATILKEICNLIYNKENIN